MPNAPENPTELLEAISSGDLEARERLFEILYKELHALSHAAMQKEYAGHPLQTTELVHETYLRLIRNKDIRCRNRSHFFSLAAMAMRRILVSEARKKMAAKRGRGRSPTPIDRPSRLDQRSATVGIHIEDVEALDKALEKLESLEENKRKSTIVELRFFVGLTLEQTAEVLGVSLATVKRDWEFTRTWLHRELSGGKK